MSSALFGPFLLLGLLIIIGVLLLVIFFNLTLQRSMAAVSKKNQTILPGLIWLNFIPIPILNPLWTMIFGIMTCKAMNKDAGKKIAPITLAYVYPSISLVISLLSLLTNLGFRASRDTAEIISIVVALASIIALVLWIVFWVQLKNAKNELNRMTVSTSDEETLDSGFMAEEL